jgi:ketosteroid isomerase-like protein
MSAAENKALIEANFAAFNARDVDGGSKMVTPSTELLDAASGRTLVGPDGLREYWQGWFSAFSDGQVEVLNCVAADDDRGTVVTEFIGRGTQDGPLVGADGQQVPPTGRRAEVRFCQVATVRDGQITGLRLYYDMMTMLGQLGVLPAAGQAATAST